MSYTATKRRKKREKQKMLEGELGTKEKDYIKTPTPALLKEISVIRSTLDSLLTQDAEKKMRFVRQKLYEHGDKPGKYLAYLAKKRADSQSIATITDSDGNHLYENKLISDSFKTFYTNLYASELPNDAHKLMENFFCKIELPTISEEQRPLLNAPITKEEIMFAIKNLQNGKAPGPDGFCSEFYKEFHGLILEPLRDMFNHSFSNDQLPQTLREANISLILKKGKCPESCSSYRPISLLNVDRKLLSKILATRLEDSLPLIVKGDQTGFIKVRKSCNNVRRLLNVIQAYQQSAVDGLVLSLDAEKAFDRVEWSYLLFALNKFGLGDNFIKWVKVLYDDPQAAVLTNGLRSNSFSIHRGTRQGCPLSPLLFALVMEPLAEAIRVTPAIQGLLIGDVHHKISLYADDVLIFISSPETSITALINIIELFSEFSGYKINLTKSEAMPLGSLHSVPNTSPPFPFKWSPSGFMYLGIFVTPKFQQMYKANFVPLFDTIRQDLEHWNSLPISWLGRISLLKMNILPRLLYPIQMIPVLLSNKVIKDVNGWLSSFIWSKRKPRLKMAILQLPSSMGGLDLPNIRFYQWCAHLCYISDWITNDDSSIWLDIETSLSKYPLQDLLFFRSFKSVEDHCNNPVTLNTLKVWRSVQRFLGRSKLTSALTPILNNPDFSPGLLDAGFNFWLNKGIRRLNDLFADKILLSFEQMVEKYRLPKQDFFRFLQVRHYILKSTTLIGNPGVSVIEIMLFSHKGKCL
uniref:Reverse transcriptase domain-containing protein n=1 Tax=Oncorhynchus mykiss TaxID=8022 RepID=A0A8K9V8C7_ONCMY